TACAAGRTIVRLGVKLALTMTALVAAVVVTAIWSIDTYQRRAKVEELAKKIDDKVAVMQEVQRTDLRVLGYISRGFADEPRTKALLNTAELDDATLKDAVREIRDRTSVDLILVSSPTGAIRANVTATGKEVAVPQGHIKSLDGPNARSEFVEAWSLDGEL